MANTTGLAIYHKHEKSTRITTLSLCLCVGGWMDGLMDWRVGDFLPQSFAIVIGELFDVV